MAIGGAFLGGGAEIVPAGFCKLELEILTEDRNNLVATFTIKGTSTYTVTAGADGRAVYTVPSGQTYTVSVNTTGYDNIASQTVVAESGTVRYVRFEAFEGRVKRSGDTMSGDLTIHRTAPLFTFKSSNLPAGDYPTTGFKCGTRIQDTGNKTRGAFQFFLLNDSDNLQMIAYDKDGANPVTLTLSSRGYATAPSWSVGTNDNSDKILTIKMANSLPSLVHTTGNETISGEKTFTGITTFNYGNGTQYNTELSTSQAISVIRAYGNTGNFAVYRNPDSTSMRFNLRNKGGAWKQIDFYNNDDNTAYITIPPTPADATSNEIATANWSIGKFVQKSGDTMTGNLYIEASSNRFVYIKRTDLDRDVEQVFPTSGTTTVGGFIVVDKDGGAIGGMNRAVSPSEVSVTLQNSQTVNGTLRHCNLSLKIAKDGSMYATVPTPSDSSDNSTKISTTAWVNTADSVVHKTGNETISGSKTFTSSPTIQNTWLWFKNGTITTGGIYSAYLSDKTMGSTYMRTYNSKGQNTSIAVQLTDDGVGAGYAPTTPSTATSNEIATADWVNGKLANRVQKLTLNGTISDGVIVTTDIQANDTVFVSITTPSDISPITYAVDIPSTVEGAMLVRSSSHITEKSDGKLYSIDIYAQYRKTAWHIGIIQRGITGGGVSNPAVVSFYGHILRAE